MVLRSRILWGILAWSSYCESLSALQNRVPVWTTYNDDTIVIDRHTLIFHLKGWRKSLVIYVICEAVILPKVVIYWLSYMVGKFELKHIFVSSSGKGVWTLEESLIKFTKGSVAHISLCTVYICSSNSATISTFSETPLWMDKDSVTLEYLVLTSPLKLEVIKTCYACSSLFPWRSPDYDRSYVLTCLAVEDDLSRHQLALTEYSWYSGLRIKFNGKRHD